MENEDIVDPRFCRHEFPAEVFTSMTETDPARRFYGCNIREFDDCGYFLWIDPELSEYYKIAFERLKVGSERALELVTGLMLMETTHHEKLRLKTSDCEALQRQLERDRASIEELESVNKKYKSKLRSMYFAYVSAAIIVALKILM